MDIFDWFLCCFSSDPVSSSGVLQFKTQMFFLVSLTLTYKNKIYVEYLSPWHTAVCVLLLKLNVFQPKAIKYCQKVESKSSKTNRKVFIYGIRGSRGTWDVYERPLVWTPQVSFMKLLFSFFYLTQLTRFWRGSYFELSFINRLFSDINTESVLSWHV